MVEFTTVKIPVKLYERVKKKVKDGSDDYISIGEFIRSAVRAELKTKVVIIRYPNDEETIKPEYKTKRGRRVRNKGDPDKKNTITVDADKPNKNSSSGHMFGDREDD